MTDFDNYGPEDELSEEELDGVAGGEEEEEELQM
tara:strand:- start:403 stop:504 length:102 start_codon:yes stop_codon:yes gene_type:complete